MNGLASSAAGAMDVLWFENRRIRLCPQIADVDLAPQGKFNHHSQRMLDTSRLALRHPDGKAIKGFRHFDLTSQT